MRVEDVRARPSVQEVAAALKGGQPARSAQDLRIAISIYRLLAQGAPASPADITSYARAPIGDVEKCLAAWPGVFRDSQRRVAGFWGLTVQEMPPHEITFDGVRLWAWCAWDTLFLPARVGRVADVQSRCPVSGREITLRVARDRIESVNPEDVAVSFLIPDGTFGGDVITRFCQFIHFFASRAFADTWVADHPGTFVLTLPEAFELARRSNVEFVDAVQDDR